MMTTCNASVVQLIGDGFLLLSVQVYWHNVKSFVLKILRIYQN